MNQINDLREILLKTDAFAYLLGCNEALELYYSRHKEFNHKTFIETIYEIEDNNVFEMLKVCEKENQI